MDWIPILIFAAVLFGVVFLKRLSFVSPDKARQLLEQGARVVDVRSPGEFATGHLPGAVNIPLGDLSHELPRRFPGKDQPLLLHCLSGARSGMAKRQLKSMGYTHAFNLGSYGRAARILREGQKA